MQSTLDAEVREEIQRILHSGTFHRSESLQRVLSYLTEKSLSDTADQIKEYAIGMDVFGKSPDYDTRLDSSVRIQVGRLRQKLIEYYVAEGVNDEIVVALPKGQFKLVFEHRAPGSSLPSAPLPETTNAVEVRSIDPERSGEGPWRRVALALTAILTVVLVWGSISYIRLRGSLPNNSSELRWTPAAEAFWRPFVEGNRPLIIAAGVPLFVGLRGCCFFRELEGSNHWDEAVQTPNFKKMRDAFNGPDLFQARSYTTVGQATSLMLLGGLLGQRIPKIRFARSNELSWQQLSDNNVILLGSRTLYELLSALPVKPEIVMEPNGLRILHPAPGEPAFIPDGKLGSDGFVADNEELHVLIGVLPGPNGKGVVGVFTGSLGAGSFAARNTRPDGFANSIGVGSLPAVQYVTTAATLEEFATRIKEKTGKVPAYFQVAVGVKFKGGVPVSSRYLLSRELRIESPSATPRANQ
jgi:hypothetical protein